MLYRYIKFMGRRSIFAILLINIGLLLQKQKISIQFIILFTFICLLYFFIIFIYHENNNHNRHQINNQNTIDQQQHDEFELQGNTVVNA